MNKKSSNEEVPDQENPNSSFNDNEEEKTQDEVASDLSLIHI